jgi:mRNA interferase MazF
MAFQGDYGKPRPALIVQADVFLDHASVTVLRLSSDLHDADLFRIEVLPSPVTGLRRRSQIMVDKIATYPKEKVGTIIGRLDAGTLAAVDGALATWLGLRSHPASGIAAL